MKISKKSQYGLRAIINLAQKDGTFCSLKEISQEEKIPFNYLEKICSQMEKGGLLKSKKGAYGGYSLSKKPKDITIGELFKCLDEKMLLVDCIGGVCSQRKHCKSINAWLKIQKSLEKTINSITLISLIK
jgi:Rrf2 family protein